MRLRTPFTAVASILLLLALPACGGGGDGSGGAAPNGSGGATEPSGLTAEQLEHGIGPVSAFEPGPLDETLAASGEELFKTKCSACHRIEERYIGPALGDVTERRSPAFVMNMILNPEEMTQKHPEAKKLLAEYVAPMANQSLTQDEARAILEYLRKAAQ